MTKHEIREGIAQIFEKYRVSVRKDPKIDFRNLAVQDVLTYLHSQGVVLKVDKEMIYKEFTSKDEAYKYKQAQQNMLEAGYVAVESLIEEDNGIDKNTP